MPRQLALLLVERARLDMALGEWKSAEEDVDHCLRLMVAERNLWNAEIVTMARLIRGFAREAQKDPAGAARAWEEASLSRAPDVGPDKAAKLRWWAGAPLREMMPQLIQAGLAKELSLDEGKAILTRAIDSFLGDAALKRAVLLGATLEPSTCTAYGTMWRTERGRKLARRYVLHEVPFPEAVRLPVFLHAHEVIRQQAFGGEFTPDEDELVWELIQKTYALVREGKAKKADLKTDLAPLGIVWQFGRSFGGPLLPAQLDPYPEVRGPLAYVLGRRCLGKKRKEEAQSLFRTALQDAGPGTALGRLARSWLEQAGANK
jgi:hypothetical protein